MKKILLLFVLLFSITAFSQDKNENEMRTIWEAKSDAMSEFPTGIKGFRQEVINNFRTRKVTGKGINRTEIRFSIENDGSLSEIQAFGENESLNEEAIRAVSKVKKKWLPAKVKGEKVKSKFRFPLTINI
ncbi:energy transducer TonB [Epilithonimonas arachidiradicis]|uniref:TonB-like protein n=1 Tax=Epilithonimonas arachidiradicis TaxID=1617282 RepID=A0A420DDB8_9FLAO|nr:energy transducer TonB [Epilithonimonas arachidiradicis]RKE89814.1 TonB-like protein [Epilithonimonas arachidiradicis]GGG45528.1 hypothetical protein GCM10007332_03730 [Epilithonimonas arachidiradicis]